MFVVATSDGVVTPSFVFSRVLRLNVEAYKKFLEEVVLPWIEWVVVEGLYAM